MSILARSRHLNKGIKCVTVAKLLEVSDSFLPR